MKKNDYPFPVNEWTEKEIEVPALKGEFDDSGNFKGIKRGTKKAKQRTYYAQTTPRRVVCSQHEYFVLDRGKYILKCKHCDWHMQTYPPTHKFDEATGILTYRKTGQRL